MAGSGLARRPGNLTLLSSPLARTANLAAFTVTLSPLGLLPMASSPTRRDPSCDEECKAHAQHEHEQIAQVHGHGRLVCRFAGEDGPALTPSRSRRIRL